MSTVRNKQRLLRLLRYLYMNTDEDHPVTTNDLVALFQEEDANASRKTVKDDIDILIEEGFDIVTVKSYYNSFFMGSRPLELPEIKLLIDAISSARFITKDKSEQLIEKLSQFVSKSQSEKLVRHIYTADRLKTDNTQIYYTVDAITDAIDQERKIQFQYFDYTPEKDKILKHNGYVYICSPYALVWDDNHYYVVGYSEKHQAIGNFRIDRIHHPMIRSEAATPVPANFDIEEHVNKSIRMFGGDEVEVTLECQNNLMRYVIDRFGEDINTWKSSEETFRAKVKVADSPTFYGWLFQFGGKIKIVDPKSVIKEYKHILEDTLNDYINH